MAKYTRSILQTSSDSVRAENRAAAQFPLDEEDRTVVFKIIDTMLTKKKFKDFFNNNIAAL